MSPSLDRRRLLVGSLLLAGTVPLSPALQAACKAMRERWPAEGELVGGNERSLVLSTARALMVKLGVAALVTIDDGGLPRVRSVGTRDPEEDLTVWVMTHAVSRKVQQIRARPEVALHYVDTEQVAQVTLMGIAEVHEEVETVRSKNFFDEALTAKWWPGFPEGYVMIAVRPLWLEISAPYAGIKGDGARWRPAGLKL
jgi:general stress protein 26